MNARHKILFFSDHPLSTSGVGTQARYLISGLVATGKYSFRCFGAAIKHENYDVVTVNEHFIVKPIDGFGSTEMIRLALANEKPDAILLFTDPRFFITHFEMADEIHQICPIAYNHLWDNPPWPAFNKPIYESIDLINCINWPTYEMVKERFPEKTNFIPHAVPADLFFPLPPSEVQQRKHVVLNGRSPNEFVMLWVNRNARRKMPGDLLVAWKHFLDDLERKHGHKNATLIMHTDPLDNEGPNLYQIIDMLNIQNHVLFSKDRVGFTEMNILYNVADAVINVSCNEGHGLTTHEAMQCGKPIIALKTGGLTRQVVDHRDGTENGIALEPEVRSLVGSQLVPYIYEDLVSTKTVVNAMMKMYELGPLGRAALGQKAREYVQSEYKLENTIKRWDETLDNCIKTWRNNRKQWSCTVI